MKRLKKTLGFLIRLTMLNLFSMVIDILVSCIFLKKPQDYTLVLIVFSYLITFALLYYFPKHFKDLLSTQKVKTVSVKKSFFIILFGFGFSVILLTCIFYSDRFFPSYGEVNSKILSQSNLIINIICTVLLIPVCEEIMFRGIIFNFFKKNYSLTTSIILQSLIFGISHGNVLQGMYTFIGGILLSLIYLYCDSIVGSILLHIVFNLFGSVILPSLLFKQNSINYLIVIIGVIVFIFSTFKILSDYKTYTNNVSNLT
ncbi:CPBP family intramembrane glutamic endopeptidase [Paraclostridium bifermentans]|uniref:CPBP family intramembrane glutamic endopeptidase n=1 Tax=Paraclostridium bifermentans TaxID=1490 RepID=UPI00115B3AE5|nr:type II CAAX endopeptidase family protein [Paraclostridium bifermentans]TQO56350.1 CPBP family intramembrane metalloprotease [Paraclostridium bifermentans]GKZ02212.1 hypothetical protein ANS014_06460 [Paraclostridium bifermentans]GKZ05985.1 hypothetical protein ANS015_08680 [Paraclostridium bifermentans]GKZ10739.1 hypothetical protein ANS017_21230 [Paraclostridium bifermentans]